MIEASSEVEQRPGPMPILHKLALVAEVLATYVHVRLLMLRDDTRPTVDALRGNCSAPTDERGALIVGIRLGRVVTRTLRVLPTDSRCLVKSLVLTAMLGRRGLAGTVVIGVRTDPAFEAHAWVELAGRHLLPAFEDSFSRLVEL